MLSEQEIRVAIDDAFGADTPRTIELHPSGAAAIAIHPGDQFVAIESTATQDEWGVSVNPSPESAFTGHDTAVPTLVEALRSAQDAVRA
ncbi:hypothetical protein [Kribbella sp. NPDC055071]